MEEVYKDILECDGFQISNLGKVKDVKTGKHKRVTVDKENGNRTVKLNGKIFIVHELVAKAFLDGNGDIIHIDGNMANNKVENLIYESEMKIKEEVVEEIVEVKEEVIEEIVEEVVEEVVEKEDFIAKQDIKVEENYIKSMKGTSKKKSPLANVIKRLNEK